MAGLGKLDPRLGLLSLYPERIENNRQSYSLQKSVDGWTVRAVITYSGDPEELVAAGAWIICSIDDIYVAEILISDLERIASLPGVVYVESSLRDHAQLDKSIPMIEGLKARQQFGLSGRGVLIGIVDSGIDWKHEHFIRPDGTTRIKFILDLSEEGPFYGGRLYSEETINAALEGMAEVNQFDYSGHGSHVAGIAAGDGSSKEPVASYAGVAPEAELIMIKATRDARSSEFETADQLIGLAFIDSVARIWDEPYVVNLSFGGHGGAHDASSPVERAIDKLVGRGIDGSVVVTVAGNDREEDMHAQAELSKNRQRVDITLEVDRYSRQAGRGNDNIQIDGWYGGSSRISVTLITPEGEVLGPIGQAQVYDRKTSEGAIYAWNGYYDAGTGYRPGVNPFNGDREIYIEISDAEAFAPPASGTWTLRFEGESGTVDIYRTAATMTTRFVKGNLESGKIAIPGTAHNAITVGAFVSKKNWHDMDKHYLTIDAENELTIGGIANFSSTGPTRDGRNKPDIMAPGEVIASSYSQDASPDNTASIFSSSNSEFPNAYILPGKLSAISLGTSMAAPHITGVVALLLEKYPHATAIQIRNILIQSARKDVLVGSVPNDDWGWGKVDAYAALQLTPGEEPPLDYKLIHAYPNPFSTRTAIEFELPLAKSYQKTTIRIFNILGQQVRLLLDESKSADKHQVFWDGRDDHGFLLTSGVYFIELVSGTFQQVQKIVFVGPKG